MKRCHVSSGIDQIGAYTDLLADKKIGLMTGPTGINHDLRSTIDIIREMSDLTALYAVEHGIRGEVQAGEKVTSGTDPDSGLPVYSAYGKNSHFTDEMLDQFDCLVFDMQDVGARFYTYIYSLSYAMEACSRAGKSMIVLDRINPIGGSRVSGICIEKELNSFVGNYGLPTQYGMTIGEYAGFVKDYLGLNLSLTVVPLKGWERSMYLDDTDLPWVMTSPNCQNLDAALCYIGTCIFEGTNISEGRGTTVPFQVIGSPFIDGAALEKHMAQKDTPGIHFRRMSFVPTFSKYKDELCHGVQMHILEREQADVFGAGLLLLDTIREMYPDKLEFLHYPEDTRYTFDKLLGTQTYRTGAQSVTEVLARAGVESEKFRKMRQKWLLY